jgi:hypothetical protein
MTFIVLAEHLSQAQSLYKRFLGDPGILGSFVSMTVSLS